MSNDSMINKVPLRRFHFVNIIVITDRLIDLKEMNDLLKVKVGCFNSTIFGCLVSVMSVVFVYHWDLIQFSMGSYSPKRRIMGNGFQVFNHPNVSF